MQHQNIVREFIRFIPLRVLSRNFTFCIIHILLLRNIKSRQRQNLYKSRNRRESEFCKVIPARGCHCCNFRYWCIPMNQMARYSGFDETRGRVDRDRRRERFPSRKQSPYVFHPPLLMSLIHPRSLLIIAGAFASSLVASSTESPPLFARVDARRDRRRTVETTERGWYTAINKRDVEIYLST